MPCRRSERACPTAKHALVSGAMQVFRFLSYPCFILFGWFRLRLCFFQSSVELTHPPGPSPRARLLQTSVIPAAEDPAFQQSMVEGGGTQRAVVDLLVEQVGGMLSPRQAVPYGRTYRGPLCRWWTAVNTKLAFFVFLFFCACSA